jgi:hypothetical protein
MVHLGTISVLIALYAVTLTIQAVQHREQQLSGFAIQITYQSGKSTYFLMSGRELKRDGSFTIPPGEIIKHADKDSEQVSEVYVAASAEGDAWKLKVWVVKGEFGDKGRQDVATFLVRENEKVTVTEMGLFGIKAFDVSVVRVNESAAVQPRLRNRTESIAVTNVEVTTVPSPYRIFLRNLSHKNVLALELNTYNGEQMLLLKWPQGTWDHPLIEPGGTYEEEMPSTGRGQTTPDGYTPEQSTSIEISTVVFADGTYEGKPYLAAGTKAQMMGSRRQLRRVLPLIQTALVSMDSGDGNVLTKLKEAVSLLSEDSDPSQLNDLQGQFSTLDDGMRKNLVNFERAGLHNVKANLLKEIGAFGKADEPTSGSSAREWIVKTHERYERWLSALRGQ